MPRKLACREGIGDLLADGLPAAAARIGKGAGEYLLTAKGSPSDLHVAPIKTRALAVRGAGGVGVARPRDFLRRCRGLLDSIREAKFYPELHEVGLTRIHDREMRGLYEILGTVWDGGESICEVDFLRENLDRRVGCFACPVACFDGYDIVGAGSGTAKCSPYGDLSWDLRNSDLTVCWQAYAECQRYGLDARAVANVIAWLMELHEKGIIDASDTDGTPMEWGSPEAIVTMPRKLACREGIGDLLADGLPEAAARIGKGAGEYLLTAKGSPSDLHVAPIKTRALAAAVSPIGEDAQVQPFVDGVAARRYVHANDPASFEESIRKYEDRAETEVGIRKAADPRVTDGKAALIRQDEERTHISDMTGVCAWLTPFMGLPADAEVIAEFMTLGLGTTVDAAMLAEAATRVHHLERAFLGRCGLGRGDDSLSKAYYGRLRPGGKPDPELGCSETELETMKDDYYRLLEWDLNTGLPTRETLVKHGLSDVADRLKL
jgi:aldehyde:ferredoxin oxidoreductase